MAAAATQPDPDPHLPDPDPVGVGPDGSVWYRSSSVSDFESGVSGAKLELVRPDGRRTPVDPPDGFETQYCVGPSGSDGSLWIFRGVDEGDGLKCLSGPDSPDWLRWDGRQWQAINRIGLGRDGTLTRWTVAEDGALWGWGAQIARLPDRLTAE